MEFSQKERYDAADLVQIIAILRNPQTGCPWDRVQTHLSIRKNLLEEAYEAAEALDADDAGMLCEELGDLMMQVAFHAQIEQERGRFDFNDVCDKTCKKLIFRHPHIFAPQQGEAAPADWEALKQAEKGRGDLASQLDSVPVTLPALMRAQKLLTRAARYGVPMQPLEWPVPQQDAQRAVGELLLAAVALAQCNGVDAEEALTRAAERFAQDAKRGLQNSEH